MASVQPPCLERCFSFVPMTTRPSSSLLRLPACCSLCAVHGGLRLGPHLLCVHACAQTGLFHPTPPTLELLHPHWSVGGVAPVNTSTSRAFWIFVCLFLQFFLCFFFNASQYDCVSEGVRVGCIDVRQGGGAPPSQCFPPL